MGVPSFLVSGRLQYTRVILIALPSLGGGLDISDDEGTLEAACSSPSVALSGGDSTQGVHSIYRNWSAESTRESQGSSSLQVIQDKCLCVN